MRIAISGNTYQHEMLEHIERLLLALAARGVQLVAERAFEPIGDKTIARAKELLVHCARLIVCPAAFGTINARNAELIEFARARGIEVMRACEGASLRNGYVPQRARLLP